MGPSRGRSCSEEFAVGDIIAGGSVSIRTSRAGGVRATRTRIARMLALLGVLCCLGACTFARAKINAEDVHEKVGNVQVGQTKAAELETIIGSPPNSIIPLPGGREVQIYNFGDSKTNGLTLILLNISKTNLRFDSAYFFIDATGVVERKSVSNYSKDVPWQWWAFGD
jgi:hypothetical protein